MRRQAWDQRRGQHHGRSNNRPGKRATTCLINAGDATVLQQGRVGSFSIVHVPASLIRLAAAQREPGRCDTGEDAMEHGRESLGSAASSTFSAKRAPRQEGANDATRLDGNDVQPLPLISHRHAISLSRMARLSVNLNKIALLRNSRRTGVPDLAMFARLALQSGAQGLTVHPRPDERHIRGSDVPMLAELMRPVRPQSELNIEGYPDDRLFHLLQEVKPEQATLVPDAPDAFTSEEGWKLTGQQADLARHAIAAIRRIGCRVVLFIDPEPAIVEKAATAGADGVEIYTGSYAEAFRTGGHGSLLQRIGATAAAARDAGLLVNAGHDLNLHNIPPLMQAVPFLAEASIGHELTADALERGWAATVTAYAKALQ